jgi:hypothetical protein
MKHDHDFAVDATMAPGAEGQQVPVIRTRPASGIARWLGLGKASRRAFAGWIADPLHTWP